MQRRKMPAPPSLAVDEDEGDDELNKDSGEGEREFSSDSGSGEEVEEEEVAYR